MSTQNPAQLLEQPPYGIIMKGLQTGTVIPFLGAAASSAAKLGKTAAQPPSGAALAETLAKQARFLFRCDPGSMAKLIRWTTSPAYRLLGPVSSDSDRIHAGKGVAFRVWYGRPGSFVPQIHGSGTVEVANGRETQTRIAEADAK